MSSIAPGMFERPGRKDLGHAKSGDPARAQLLGAGIAVLHEIVHFKDDKARLDRHEFSRGPFCNCVI